MVQLDWALPVHHGVRCCTALALRGSAGRFSPQLSESRTRNHIVHGDVRTCAGGPTCQCQRVKANSDHLPPAGLLYPLRGGSLSHRVGGTALLVQVSLAQWTRDFKFQVLELPVARSGHDFSESCRCTSTS